MSKPVERMLHPPGEVYKYAAATGGQVVEFNKKQLKAKLAELVDDLRMRYSLGYPSVGAKSPKENSAPSRSNLRRNSRSQKGI